LTRSIIYAKVSGFPEELGNFLIKMSVWNKAAGLYPNQVEFVRPNIQTKQ